MSKFILAMAMALTVSIGEATPMSLSALSAQPSQGLFAESSPVDNDVLAAATGAFLEDGYPAHLQAIASTLADNNLRTFGTIARIQMDNWWAEEGTQMIAANIIASR